MSDFKETWNYLDRFFKNTPNFMKIHPVQAECGQTAMTKLRFALCNFASMPEIKY
jgi:hypothetical protein